MFMTLCVFLYVCQGEDDVLACKHSRGKLTIIDGWNPNPQYTPNELDSNQNGICPYYMEYIDGRIVCT